MHRADSPSCSPSGSPAPAGLAPPSPGFASPRALLLRLEPVHHRHPVQQPRHGLGLLLVEDREGGAHDLCAMRRGSGVARVSEKGRRDRGREGERPSASSQHVPGSVKAWGRHGGEGGTAGAAAVLSVAAAASRAAVMPSSADGAATSAAAAAAAGAAVIPSADEAIGSCVRRLWQWLDGIGRSKE